MNNKTFEENRVNFSFGSNLSQVINILENITFLSKQPHVELSKSYANKEINYFHGYREIAVEKNKSVSHEKRESLETPLRYFIIDYAEIDGSKDIVCVGTESYIL